MTEFKPPNLEQARSRERRLLMGRLITDFRNSYRYSQGNPILQHVLITLLRDYYVEAGGDMLTDIPSALVAVGAHIGRLALPPNHKPISSGVQEDFQEAFGVFIRCLTEPDYMPTRIVYDSGHNQSEQPFPREREERLKILIEMGLFFRALPPTHHYFEFKPSGGHRGK